MLEERTVAMLPGPGTRGSMRSASLLAVLLAAATAPRPAGAQTPPPAPPAEPDLFADTPPLTAPPPADPAFAARATRRRAMLATHQKLGLATLGLMAVTSVVGQLDYNDLYGKGHAGTGDYLVPHRLLAYGTLGAFTLTAGYALFAPTSYVRRPGFDTATAHKIFVSAAALGMVSQAVIGFVTARYAEVGNPRDLSGLARLHQISGYATLGFIGAAAAAWVF